MSNNANLTKVEAARQAILNGKKEQYEFNIPLPENILNILSVNSNVTITDSEVLMGQVNFSGEACLNIVYTLEDGNVNNYKNCEKFSGKLEDLTFDPNVFVKILPNIVDVDIEKSDRNNDIKVKLTLEYGIDTIKNQEINVFSNNDPSTFIKESEIEVTKHLKRNCIQFNQNTVFDTKLPVRQIVSTTSTALLTKADALNGMIVFEGEVITRILYTTEEDRPVFVSSINKENFREEVEDQAATQNSLLEAFVRVLNREVEEKINAQEKTIEISVPVKICYDLFETQPVSIIVDAFSTQNELNLTTEAFLSNQVSAYELVENKIDGNISLDEQALRIDKVLGIDGIYLTINEQKIEDGELQVEGMIHFNLIFLNDEQERVNSVAVEIPFSFKEKIEEKDLAVRTENSLVELDAVVKRGRDIYVDGKIKTSIWTSKEVKNAIVSAIENGDNLPPRDGTIEIYFANQNETFWDVAKDLKISESTLRAQNQDIVEPFTKAEKIIYFEQKNLPEV